ncbi:splicing factor ESS-2 homolog [Nephila pilipes]|uniref:Splicing factor ESS-2 homolog n=1 Tax=Nephila pilipes TaxID=299642 RepID=A0A8X6URA8_NEPPI|nr:splicing factor ESS-2 homolog [Nephila pilipes]
MYSLGSSSSEEESEIETKTSTKPETAQTEENNDSDTENNNGFTVVTRKKRVPPIIIDESMNTPKLLKELSEKTGNKLNCKSINSHNDQIKEICSSQTKKRKILSEEEYTEQLEKIVTRDFFPDLPKLKAQNAYLDAMAKGDVARIQEIQLAYRLTDSTRSKIYSERSTGGSPITFETPEIKRADSPSRSESDVNNSATVVPEKNHPTLDQFLGETTSEDNASFQSVMERSEARHQQKYPWLYKDEGEEQKKVTDMLALPTSEPEFKKPELVTWAYKNRNALMYVPDGAPLTVEERLAQGRREILHAGTRFENGAPFAADAHKEAIVEAAAHHAKLKEGRVGIDGKEIQPQESPQVNGYGFVGTPLPQPGVSDTPILTWGEIEGTPFRLDGGDTPLPQTPSGQQFKMPQPSARERIAHSLADKVAKKHRKIQTPRSPSLRLSSSSALERLQSMSPAAQRLACAKLGVQRASDRALRASYSPSPLRTPLTPTPKAVTPKGRPKASDFF